MSGSARERSCLVRQAVEGRLGRREVSGSVYVSSNDLCVAGDVTARQGWCLGSEAGHRTDA